MEMPLIRSKLPVYEIGHLRDGNAFNLNVLATAIAPKNYQFIPQRNMWAIESLTVFIVDPGTCGPINFGALPLLPNGVKLEIQSNGQLRTITTLRDNIDITCVFSENALATQVLDTVAAPIGWIGRIDFYKGVLAFKEPQVLFAEKGDFIRAVVQDDLSELETFRIRYRAWRQLR